MKPLPLYRIKMTVNLPRPINGNEIRDAFEKAFTMESYPDDSQTSLNVWDREGGFDQIARTSFAYWLNVSAVVSDTVGGFNIDADGQYDSFILYNDAKHRPDTWCVMVAEERKIESMQEFFNNMLVALSEVMGVDVETIKSLNQVAK